MAIKDILSLYHYKLDRLWNNIRGLFDFRRKINNIKIVKDKKHLRYSIAINSLFLLSLYSFFMSLRTRAIGWFLLTYFFILISSDIKEFEVGHWRNWKRSR